MCHPHQKWLWNSNSISNRLHSMKLEKKRVRNLKHYWKSREKINQMWNNNSKIGKKMSRGKISPLFLLFSNLIMHNSTNIC
jgi:chorismate-pyruvate lyase